MMYKQDMAKWSWDVLMKVGPQGPDPSDYAALDLAFQFLYDYERRSIVIDVVERLIIVPHTAYRKMCDEHVPSLRSRKIGSQCYDLILHIWNKPHGHPGDGELLQKMYDIVEKRQDNSNDGLYCSKWDWYIASRTELLSLKFRKDMFMTVMSDLKSKGVNSLLDLGCGVGDFSGMWRKHNPIGSFGKVIGVDIDPWAIEQATARHRANTYECSNVITKPLPEGCDVIFSAGLFDYFPDSMFKRVLKKLKALNPKYILIGNINQSFPTKKVMEIFGWSLFDRSRLDMAMLASDIASDTQIETFTDRTGCQNWMLVKVEQ